METPDHNSSEASLTGDLGLDSILGLKEVSDVAMEEGMVLLAMQQLLNQLHASNVALARPSLPAPGTIVAAKFLPIWFRAASLLSLVDLKTLLPNPVEFFSHILKIVTGH